MIKITISQIPEIKTSYFNVLKTIQHASLCTCIYTMYNIKKSKAQEKHNSCTWIVSMTIFSKLFLNWHLCACIKRRLREREKKMTLDSLTHHYSVAPNRRRYTCIVYISYIVTLCLHPSIICIVMNVK